MEKIWLNEIELWGEVVPEEGEENAFRLSFGVKGANNYHLFSNLLKESTFDIKVPSLGHDFKAKRLYHSASYRDPLNHDTEIQFSLVYKEYVPEEEQEGEWNVFSGLFHTAINNWSRTRALAELLEEKGIIKRSEYEDRIKLIGERDFEEMKKFILNGESKDDE